MQSFSHREVLLGGFALLLALAHEAGAAIGRTPGAAGVTPRGEAAYSIRLNLPAGTNGLTPELSLEYRHGSHGGVAGIGWQLGGLSRIHRCPRTVAQDGRAGPVRQLRSDRFCLDGGRLVVVNGEPYGSEAAEYRTEIESYARIRTRGVAGTGPAQFVVEARDGRVLEYGATDDSRIDVGGAWTSGSATARIWALNRIRDRSGNTIEFRYAEDPEGGGYALSSVDYTGHPGAGLEPPYRIELTYEDRPAGDADFASEGGIAVSEMLRLSRIDVLYQGSVVRRYELGYEPSLSSAGRSRLATLRECGRRASDCLAATTLTWQDGVPGLGAESEVPMAMGGSARIRDDARWWSGDINGDGRADLIWTGGTEAGPTLRYRLARHDGFGPEVDTGLAAPGGVGLPLDYDGDGFTDALLRSPTGTWQILAGGPGGFGAPVDTGVAASAIDYRAADMDGNGLPDLVYSEIEGNSGNGLVVRVRYNRPGAGFDAVPATLYRQAIAAGYEHPEGGDFLGPRGQLIDLDGDGRDDVLMNEKFSIARISADEAVSENFAGSFRRGMPADLNGDGCTDFVYPHYTGSWRVRMSACRVSSQMREIAGPSAAGLAGDPVAIDWDGDGREDLLYRDASSVWQVVRSTGASLEPPVATGLAHGAPEGLRIADIDGDGLDDLMARADGLLRYRLHAGPAPDLLRSVRDGFGVVAAFEFAPLTRKGLHVRGRGAAYPDRDLQDARQVVERLRMSDGTGEDDMIGFAFRYEGLRRNGTGRGDLGFARQIVTREAPEALLRREQSFRQDFPFSGRTATVRLERAGGRPISESSLEWSSLLLGTGAGARRFPYPASSVVRTYSVGGGNDGSEIAVVSRRIAAIESRSGLATDVTVMTRETSGGLNPGATHTRRVRHAAVFDDEANWCLGRPRATEITLSHTLAGGAPVTTSSATVWDADACRPTQSLLEPDSNEWSVTTQLGYDRFGNPVTRSVTGAGMNPRTERIDWGADGRKPRRLTDALSHSTSIEWNEATGVPTAVIDANGLRTSWSYDEFARMIAERRPDGTRRTFHRVACTSACGPRGSYRLTVRERDDSGTTFLSARLDYDRFDRPFRAAVQRPGGGLGETVTNFDPLGRVLRQHVPYWSGAAPRGHWQYGYDDLGRVVAATLLDETGAVRRTSRFVYEGLSYTVTDPRGHATRRTFTAWGDPLQTVDALGGASRYSHDAAGRLLQASDAQGNVVSSVTYNLRGMKAGQQDMDLGAWTYSHNALGELVARTDARMRTASFTYDALGRLTRRSEPEGVTTWTWGGSAEARNVGRLVAVAGPDYSETYAYDEHGRPALRTIRSDATYEFRYTYNGEGLLDSLTYPATSGADRLRLSYSYDRGRLSRIAEAGQEAAPLWRLGAVDAAGRILDETLGENLRVVTGYDPLTGEIGYRQAGPGGGAGLQDLAYDWDEAGNLESRRDLRLGLTEQFTHDPLGRLELSRLNGVVNLALAYDAIGNVTWKSDVCPGTAACYAYHGSKKHAVIAAGAHRYSYDPNGNMVRRDDATLVYRSYNLPSYLSVPEGYYSRFWYAPDRGLLKQVANGPGLSETTVYVGGLLEKSTRSGVTAWKHYIASPTGVVAVQLRDATGSAPSNYFLLRDHLGSLDRIVDASGSREHVATSFDAFGRRRGPGWSGDASQAELAALAATTRQGFAGHEHLDHLGLVHMSGRVYDPRIARFLSADPTIHAPHFGQDLNRYSYAWNRPLAVTDPSGLEEIDCLRSPDGGCHGVTVIGLRAGSRAFPPVMFGPPGGQVASAAERDPCGQDGSAAACNRAAAAEPPGLAGEREPSRLWAQVGAASLNTLPGWYYSGLAVSALDQGDFVSAALYYGATIGDIFLIGRGSAMALASRYARTELAVTGSVSFGPMRRGPLADEVAATFRSSSYTARVLDEPLAVYRVIGEGGNPAGRFWTTVEPRGSLQSVIDFAIDQNWRNPATRIIRAEIPPGTVVYAGAAAAQRGLVGGGVQVYIPRVDARWLR